MELKKEVETSSQTCDRELLEEIGVNFNGNYKPIGFSEDFFEGTIKKHYITLYFVVEDVDSNWCAVDDLNMDEKLFPNFVHCPNEHEGIKQTGIKEKIIKILNKPINE